VGVTTRFLKLLGLFQKIFTLPVAFFSVTSPVSKTFAYLARVLCTLRHLQVNHGLQTVGFQYNLRQITASFAAGRRLQLLVGDMLLFWCSWFKYRFTILDLVLIGTFFFHFSRVLGSVVDSVNVNPSARMALTMPCVTRRKCAPTNTRDKLRYVFGIFPRLKCL